MPRKYNFNPGPATLPLEAVEKVKDALVDYKNQGFGILEMSHRHKNWEEINDQAIGLIRELLGVPQNYHILFLGGGASTQFFHIPMNYLTKDKVASYVNTGSWAQKAIKEAKKFGKVHVAASTEADKFTRMPKLEDIKIDPASVYFHITSNETIDGTQWPKYPDPGKIPMICDMSSDILSRKIDVSKFALIYAGAQKNLGPAGVTVVILRQDLHDACPDSVPTMVNYKTHAAEKSLYNTPPVISVYVMKLVLDWVKAQGGLPAIEKANEEKAKIVYGLLDEMSGYYSSTVTDKASRSRMNVTFRLPSEEIEKKFLDEAGKAGFIGLKGHRSVGGARISMYNAMPVEGIQKLAEFMKQFAAKNKK